MNAVLLVGFGSMIGGICRYLLSKFIYVKLATDFPFGTLAVNVLGCFAVGVVAELGSKVQLDEQWRLFLTAGILGGFTTFSAFSVETVALLKAGNIGYAMMYAAMSVMLGLVATFMGMFIMK